MPTGVRRNRAFFIIAVLLAASMALTGVGAWTVLVAQPRMTAAPDALLAPLAARLVAASVLSAQTAAVLYAPAGKQGLLVPKRRAQTVSLQPVTNDTAQSLSLSGHAP